MLSRFLDANSPKIDSAIASPSEGATSYQVIPASYARSSASSPLRSPIRPPSDAQPNPTLDTLLPRASTQTSFIANTHFSLFTIIAVGRPVTCDLPTPNRSQVALLKRPPRWIGLPLVGKRLLDAT